MKKLVLGTVATAFVVMGFTSIGVSAEKDWGVYQSEDRRSGYTYAAPETQAIQDDDFENPGFIWVEQGEELFSEVDGKEGKSCASCHEDADKSMAKVGTTYPVYDKKLKKMINVEQRINQCRTDRMWAKAWKYESSQLLSMTAFVRNQSAGEPMNVKIDGDAAPFYAKGKDFFNERRGQLNMACSNCHADNPGTMIRANMLSEGQTNGFPVYRLKWQKVGSTHRRFRGCNKNVRAKPYAYGSEEYVNLELYTGWRGRGLPVEAPAVRN